MRKLLFLFLLIPFIGKAQLYHTMPQYGYQMQRADVQYVLKVPSDTTTNKTGVARIGTTLYAGNGTYWTGSGSVASFSSGNLSPLFTTSVATSTSTPALSFSLSNAGGYTLFGRGSGSGSPSYLASIDSNWVTGLHTENYYNTKYLQTASNGLTALSGNIKLGGTLTANTNIETATYTLNSTGGTGKLQLTLDPVNMYWAMGDINGDFGNATSIHITDSIGEVRVDGALKVQEIKNENPGSATTTEFPIFYNEDNQYLTAGTGVDSIWRFSSDSIRFRVRSSITAKAGTWGIYAPSAGSGLTVGTTAIASGTDTKVLYNNAGTLGEYTISGSGNVAMTTSPTFTTPALGTPSALVGTNITGTAASLTAGNATTLATSRNLNNAAFNGSANVLVPDKNPSIMALLGSAILAEPVTGDVFKTASSANLTDGQVRWVAVYIPGTMTITGIKWIQQTQGNYTADNYNGVGLYSYSGGNLTLVASSTNDGNIWKATSFTWSSKAFSSTYAASPGLYFAALIYNSSAQTTAPALRVNQLSSDLLNTVDFTNSAKLGASLTGQTGFPAGPTAMSTLATMSGVAYLALY